MKNLENEVKSQSSQNRVIDTFLWVFVIVSLLLGLTIYCFYTSNSSSIEELNYTKDIHSLRAEMQEFTPKQTQLFDGIHVMGIINNLKPGSLHGLHIYEYSDLVLVNRTSYVNSHLKSYIFKHYNPKHMRHACPSTGNQQPYHEGDLGNIIADDKGQAKFSIVKRNTGARALSGRIIVVNKHEDKCEGDREADTVEDVFAFGILGAVMPLKANNGLINDGKDEKFLRQMSIIKEKNEKEIKEKAEREKKEKEIVERNERERKEFEQKLYQEREQELEREKEKERRKKEESELKEKEEKEKAEKLNKKEAEPIIYDLTNVQKTNSKENQGKSLFSFLPNLENNSSNELIKIENTQENDNAQPKAEIIPKTNHLNLRKKANSENFEDSDKKLKKHNKSQSKLFNDYSYDEKSKKNSKKDFKKYNEILEKQKKIKDEDEEEENSPPVLTQLSHKIKVDDSDENNENVLKFDDLDEEENQKILSDNAFYNKFKQIGTQKRNHLKKKNHKKNHKLLGKRNAFYPFDLIKFRQNDILDEIQNLKNITLFNSSQNQNSSNLIQKHINSTLNNSPIINKTLPLSPNNHTTFEKKINNTIKINKTEFLKNVTNQNRNNSTNTIEKKSESTIKIFENLENQKILQDKMNQKDETRLFLSNLKKNIVKMDKLINKF